MNEERLAQLEQLAANVQGLMAGASFLKAGVRTWAMRAAFTCSAPEPRAVCSGCGQRVPVLEMRGGVLSNPFRFLGRFCEACQGVEGVEGVRPPYGALPALEDKGPTAGGAQ